MITLVFFFVVAGPPEAGGSPATQDNPHFATAVQAWKQQRWPEAAEAFARAYDLDPRPEYVFARAQSLRFAQQCAEAIEAYRGFIALDPPRGAVDEARDHIEACGGDPDGASEPVPAPVSPPSPSVDPSTPATAVESRPEDLARPWWRDRGGHALGWSGVALTGVGAGLIAEALVRRGRGERAGDEQAYRDARRDGPALLYAGIPVAAVGGALVLAAAVRFAMVHRRSKRGGNAPRSARLRGGVAPGGFCVAWSP